MRFAFTEDQELFRQALAEMLEKECPHEVLAEAWASAGGRVPGLWDRLAEMGVVALTTPEEAGGLGMNELDLVLLLEESGRWALPEPLLETTAIAAPLIAPVPRGLLPVCPRIASISSPATSKKRDLLTSYGSRRSTAGNILTCWC